jgi:hypothetical protein
MSNTNESQEQKQLEPAPFLFSEQTIQALTEAERRGEYTLERVRQVRPELIPDVIKLRGQCIGQLRIAKLLGVHHRTIAAIDYAYPDQIEEQKRRRAAKYQSTADKLVELVDDDPESIPPNVRCLAASQLVDKAQLLSGGPTANLAIDLTSRVDVSGSFKKFGEIMEEIIALRKAGTIDIDKFKELGCNALDTLKVETGLGPKKAVPIMGADESAFTGLPMLSGPGSELENGS